MQFSLKPRMVTSLELTSPGAPDPTTCLFPSSKQMNIIVVEECWFFSRSLARDQNKIQLFWWLPRCGSFWPRVYEIRCVCPLPLPILQLLFLCGVVVLLIIFRFQTHVWKQHVQCDMKGSWPVWYACQRGPVVPVNPSVASGVIVEWLLENIWVNICQSGGAAGGLPLLSCLESQWLFNYPHLDLIFTFVD